MDISTDFFDISPEFLVVYPTIIGEHLVLIFLWESRTSVVMLFLMSRYSCHASSACICFALLYN